jgi:hypothetical protein
LRFNRAVASAQAKVREITEKELRHWQMLDAFEDAVRRVFSQAKLHRNLVEPDRQLTHGRYLKLFLFGLFNPVVETMRGLCEVSALGRVQQEVCGIEVKPARFSEMQHLIDPTLLRFVFQDLVEQSHSRFEPHPKLAHLNVIAQDGSLWSALPRMAWAEYGVGRDGEANGVRLHLRFNIVKGLPEDATVEPGKSCERQALRQMCEPGQINVSDRLYGEDYRLFHAVQKGGGFFVFRIRENAVINPQEEIPLTAEDEAAGVVRHVWATLGATEALRSIRLRVIEIRTKDQHLLLVSNLSIDKTSAALVGLIYRKRWDIELFFRWIKCILGCRHFFAESPQGVAIQLYLALIASVLLLYYTGLRPNKRAMELIHMYLMGWATAEELAQRLKKQTQKHPSAKKS